MAYISSIGTTTYTIGTGEDEPGRTITLNGREHQIDWREIASLAANREGKTEKGGRYSLLIDGQSYEIFARRLINPDEPDETVYEIYISGQRFEVRVEDERQRVLTGSIKAARETGEVKLRAPMPGLVLNVTRAAGESVEREETIVVLEAMKMENNLAAPQAGIVKEVRVSRGQTVNQGDILVIIGRE